MNALALEGEASGQGSQELRLSSARADFSVAGILRLLGSGPGAQILMALGSRSLRTEQLAERVQGFSSRSVYRYVSRMEAHDLIDRHREPGVPSKVILSLREPTGRELFRLLRTFTATAGSRAFSNGRWSGPWSPMNLLSELWQLDFVKELSREPRPVTELSRVARDLTYHQVNRRVGLFHSGGLLLASPAKGAGKRYALSDYGRSSMALVAGIGRWRRHVIADGIPGLSAGEMVTVLRAVIPLAMLPHYSEMTLSLGVSGDVDGSGHRSVQTLGVEVDGSGKLRCLDTDAVQGNGSAIATTNTWFSALLDGNRGRVQVRGDLTLVDSLLTRIYDVLWEQD
jgi:DNA-binding HxlR family transcriptional regulator